MRTTTKLLSAVVLALGGMAQAVAQIVSTTPVADVNELSEGYYVIKGSKNGTPDGNTGFIYYQSTSPNYMVDGNKQTYESNEKPDYNYIWKLTWSGEGEDRTFTLQNVESGRYFAASSTTTQTMAGDEVANLRVDVEEGTGDWFLAATNYQVNEQYLYVTINSGLKLGWWNGFANDADAVVTFYKVDGLTDVTYKYNVTNVGITFKQTATQFVGNDYEAPAVNFYTVTYQPEGTVKDSETQPVEVECTASYPGGLVPKALTADGQFATGAKWYTLSVRGGQAVVATADGIRTKGQTRQLAKGNMWTFVKEDGTPDGFKVYNLLKGPASPLYLSSDANSTDASFATGSEVKNGTTTFTITTNGDGSGFNLQYPGNSNANLGDHHNGPLSVWNDGRSAGDVGSRFVVAEVDDLLLMISHTGGSYVGSLLLSEDTEAAVAAYDNFTHDIQTTAALETLIDFDYSALPRLQLTDGGYYRIRNCYSSGNPCLTADGELQSLAYDATSASQIWKLESVGGGKYKLTSQRVTGSSLTDDDPKHMTTGPADGESVLTFYIGENHANDANGIDGLMWFLDTEHDAADNDNATALYGNGTGTVVIRPNLWGASAWYIVEASTLDFTVSDAGYATAHFAFPVRMDEGMTAYVAASRENNVITLAEIENGEVPAMTPVVIAAKPATYKLDILAEAPADVESNVESNLLSGSLLPYDIQESPAYIFGVDEAGTPTFYRVADDDSSQLGANKAYFAPQGDSAASRYILRFGNEGTTGIQGVGTADEAESETYYDLSGRRVLYPAKGIYVTGSGKKVFLK